MAKRGRPKLIESPEVLWDLFCEYKNWVEQNPIEKKVEGNKGFVISKESLKRPLTLEGFEIWCFNNGIIADLGHYFANTNEAYTEFCTICLIIRKVIREDQISGGMVGIYNPSITQRLNNLVERSEVKNTGTTVMLVENKPNEQNEPIKD